MADRKSPVHQEDRCSVKGCENTAERSISIEAADSVGMEIEESHRRAHLCKDHYKAYKKASKSDRTIDNLGH